MWVTVYVGVYVQNRYSALKARSPALPALASLSVSAKSVLGWEVGIDETVKTLW